MNDKPKRKRLNPIKAQPISEQAYLELEKKYGFTVEELRKMARELNVARPRLEMHLQVLKLEKVKNK